MTINSLSISYPDFKLHDIIDPDEFDTNNAQIVNKVNEIRNVVNQITDAVDNNSGASIISLKPIAPFASNKLQDFLAEVIFRLRANESGNPGSALIGTPHIFGLEGATVAEQLASIKVLLDTLYVAIGNTNTTHTSHKNAPTLDHPDGSVTTAKIADLATTTAKLANNAVTNPKLANNSVETRNITNGHVTTEKLADGGVTNVKLADGSVSAGKIASNAVTTAKVQDGAITAVKTASDVARKAQVDAVQGFLDYHRSDTVAHVTSSDRSNWNGKAPGSVVTTVDTHINNQDIHMTTAERNKLSGIQENAEQNQNAFSTVNNISATSKSDAVKIVGGVGITVSTNPTTKEVTLDATGDSAPGKHANTHKYGGSDYIAGINIIPEQSITVLPSGLPLGITTFPTYSPEWLGISGSASGIGYASVENNVVQPDATITAKQTVTLYYESRAYAGTFVRVGFNDYWNAFVRVDGAPVNDFVRNTNFAVTGGSANSFTVSTNPAPTAYVDGMRISFKANRNNTGSSSLNWNGLGAKGLVDSKGNGLAANKIIDGVIYSWVYSSTGNNGNGAFILQGEGGEYGTAQPQHVLAPYTIGTDDGLVAGTMVDRSGDNVAVANTGQSTTTLKLRPPEGYYDGVNDWVTLLSAGWLTYNIAEGSDIFGKKGTLKVPDNVPDNYTSSWVLRNASVAFGTSAVLDVAYGSTSNDSSGVFVAVGEDGKLATSHDGINWTMRNSGFFGTSNINGVTYGANKFVAVGDNGQVAYSIFGEDWTHRTSGFGSTRINGIAYGIASDFAAFAIVGDDGKVAYSDTGYTWALAYTPSNTKSLYGVVHGVNMFIAFGSNGEVIYTYFPDVWDRASHPLLTTTLYGGTYGNGIFVFVGSNGKIITSSIEDIYTWTQQEPIFGTGITIRCATFGNGMFVIAGDNGMLATSINGIDWTIMTSGYSTSHIHGVHFANGMFVTSGGGGKVATLGTKLGS